MISVHVLQAGVVMVPPSVVLKKWHSRTRAMERDVELFTRKLYQQILSGVEVNAELLAPLHSSTTDLARMLSSNVNDPELSFSKIKSRVNMVLSRPLAAWFFFFRILVVQQNMTKPTAKAPKQNYGLSFRIKSTVGYRCVKAFKWIKIVFADYVLTEHPL